MPSQQPDIQLEKQQNIETQITKDNKQETYETSKTKNSKIFILIVVLPCILIILKHICQQMHSLLKHKMPQVTLKSTFANKCTLY
jgi:plasmid rolling circle replication initiator protein Rep